MSTLTDSYDIVKPGVDENFSLEIINSNYDKLVNAIKGVSDRVDASTPIVLYSKPEYENGTDTSKNFDTVQSTKSGKTTVYSINSIELTAPGITDWSSFKYVDIYFRSMTMGLAPVHNSKRIFYPFSSDSSLCKKFMLNVMTTGNTTSGSTANKIYDDVREYIYTESTASGTKRHYLTCATWSRGLASKSGVSLAYTLRGAENMLTIYRIVGYI